MVDAADEGVSKNDEFRIINEKLFVKNEELKNFAFKIMNFAGRIRGTWSV